MICPYRIVKRKTFRWLVLRVELLEERLATSARRYRKVISDYRDLLAAYADTKAAYNDLAKAFAEQERQLKAAITVAERAIEQTDKLLERKKEQE